MPKPKPTESQPLDASPEVDATRNLLTAMQELDRLNKFTLAAVIVWMRTEWQGKSKVLHSTERAIERIFSLSAEEAANALDAAADSNLRAAVTS